MDLPVELQIIKEEIKGYALDFGLDFFETIFEILDFDELNEVASYEGFPTRYPHWRFGMAYEELQKGYAYGLQKIYEMVINNDPCYAYLLKCNNIVDQKLVIAHVYAHSDFFKNNLWFSKTNRKMINEIANHATRIRHYIEKFGEKDVENFIDICLSIENLIDIHSPFIQRKERVSKEADTEEEKRVVPKLKSKDYMDQFINPPDFLEEQRLLLEKEKARKKKFPEIPEKDVLQFLIEHAPLAKWQRDVLSIIREEAYYFAPQRQTKIMNEGWATYWHSKIMTEKGLKDSEVIDYADHHSGTLSTGATQINPYKIGVELFRDIEDRWNKGKFGKEYDECDDYLLKKQWNQNLRLGKKKLFEVRTLYNDVTFIDAFLTEDFCREHNLFTYEYDEHSHTYKIASRDFKTIKEKLLFNLTNFGYPTIYVADANYLNRGELYLFHQHEGIDLKLNEARDTLANVQKIWGRPVHLETVVEEVKTLLSYDGEEHYEREII